MSTVGSTVPVLMALRYLGAFADIRVLTAVSHTILSHTPYDLSTAVLRD